MTAKLGAVALTLTVAACAAAKASQYRNSEYGFTVVLPPGAATCRSQAPEHDGGLNIFLDSGPDGCEALQSRPFLGVYASYNSMFASTPEEFLRLTIGDRAEKVGVAPRGFELAGMNSASSRWDRDDGWIDIRVAAQRGRWPANGGAPDAEVAYINYTVMLHTTKERFAEDMERLRAILREVGISDTISD